MYVTSDGTFNMSGSASITENTASSYGGGNNIVINITSETIADDYGAYRAADRIAEKLKTLEIRDSRAYGGLAI